MNETEWVAAMTTRVEETLDVMGNVTDRLSLVAELLVSPPEGMNVDRFRTLRTDAKTALDGVDRRLDTMLDELK